MPKLSFIELIKNLFLTKNKQQDELSTWINQNLNEDVAQAFLLNCSLVLLNTTRQTEVIFLME